MIASSARDGSGNGNPLNPRHLNATAGRQSLNCLRVGEVILEAGFPTGVVNILSSYGPTAGGAISGI